jgi:hypothetical protein
MIDIDEISKDVTDLLVRVHGTINVLHKPDIIQADRKLQGIRDKLGSLLFKINKAKKDSDNTLSDLVKEVINK